VRSDMHKVIVERERYGSTRKNRKWGTRLAYVPDADYDDQPTFVSSARGRQYPSTQKWFSDVLAPLKGFLRSNIGRPWDKVFSELHQAVDVRKVTGRHIFEHLEWMVESDCSIGADRKVYGYPRGYEVTGFYVHPRTRLLCFAPRPSARERKKGRLMQQEVDELRIDDTRSFKLIGEQWFVVTYEAVEVGRYERPRAAWDVVQRRQVQLTWGRCCIAIKKRQCNREEVRSIHERIARWKRYLRRM
jgi:hypothetical protein